MRLVGAARARPMLFRGVMSRNNRCLAALAACVAFTVPIAADAKTSGFEGRISLRLQDVDPHGANYSIRGDRLSI